jgi:hypothetical protein
MRLGRRGLSATAIGFLIGVPLLLSACGATPSANAKSASTSTAPNLTTTTLGATGTAVVSAYRAGWIAYDKALATANAYDPTLPITMAQPLLQKVEIALLDDKSKGIVGLGEVQLHPKLDTVSATSSTISDCIYTDSQLIYSATGKAVPPVTPAEHERVEATLTFANGMWKVTQQSVEEGKCSAG